MIFFGIFFLAALFSGIIDKVVAFILNLREASTIGRFELYQIAFQILSEENLLMGLGIRIREGFTTTAIGSHALYVEIIFVAGLIGLFLFLIFQGMVMVNWYLQKKLLRSQTEQVVWELFGISLLGTNIWLLSDTLLALPYIPYIYFLTTGGILLFTKFLHVSHLTENMEGPLNH
jgi:O-antigen ligase